MGSCGAASEASEPAAVPGEGSLQLWCKEQGGQSSHPTSQSCQLPAEIPFAPGRSWQSLRWPDTAVTAWNCCKSVREALRGSLGRTQQEAGPCCSRDQAPAGVFLRLTPPDTIRALAPESRLLPPNVRSAPASHEEKMLFHLCPASSQPGCGIPQPSSGQRVPYPSVFQASFSTHTPLPPSKC